MSAKSGGAKTSRKQEGIKVVADNRRARFDYEILQAFEAGIELKGSEVKSLRLGRTNLAESYAAMKGGELYLLNCQYPGIPPGQPLQSRAEAAAQAASPQP